MILHSKIARRAKRANFDAPSFSVEVSWKSFLAIISRVVAYPYPQNFRDVVHKIKAGRAQQVLQNVRRPWDFCGVVAKKPVFGSSFGQLLLLSLSSIFACFQNIFRRGTNSWYDPNPEVNCSMFFWANKFSFICLAFLYYILLKKSWPISWCEDRSKIMFSV